MELALCHPSGTWNFEVAHSFNIPFNLAHV